MTLFLFAAYRNLDSESGLGEAPGLARADSKTAVLLPHKMFKLPLMMLRRKHGPLIGHKVQIKPSHWSIKLAAMRDKTAAWVIYASFGELFTHFGEDYYQTQGL